MPPSSPCWNRAERCGVRRRSRPWVSPGRPLRFEYLCFALRAAYRPSAALQAGGFVRPGGLRGRWARTGRAGGVSPRGSHLPVAPRRSLPGMARFCSQSRVQAFCLPPGGFLDVREDCGAVRPAQAARRGCFSPGALPSPGQRHRRRRRRRRQDPRGPGAGTGRLPAGNAGGGSARPPPWSTS